MAKQKEDSSDPAGVNLTGGLLAAASLLLLVVGVAYGEALLALLLPDSILGDVRPKQVAASRRALLGAAAGGFGVAALVWKLPVLARMGRRPFAATLTLAALSVLLPVYILEWALDPFTHYHPTTGLFLRDDALGWRMRPSAREEWGERLIATNSLGLRGPEISANKHPGVKRVLFLGDSVTFGFRIRENATFPRRVEALLASGPAPVEVINAGVGGYSPWQYDEYLRRDGIHLEPDVIVVGFVLNDVTEKFRLMRFGGSSAGLQLSKSMSSLQDRLARSSNIFFHARKLAMHARFGSDAANLEELDVRNLVESPEDPEVQRAWKITLENLDRLFDFAEEQGIPALLVVFPFAFQLDDPREERHPQAVLAEYAARRSLPFLDVLPLMVAAASPRAATAGAFFIDTDHLSRSGHTLVARSIAAEINEPLGSGSPEAARE